MDLHSCTGTGTGIDGMEYLSHKTFFLLDDISLGFIDLSYWKYIQFTVSFSKDFRV
jgi:hypothetical protein